MGGLAAGCTVDGFFVSFAPSVAPILLTLLFPPLSLPLSVDSAPGFEGASSRMVAAIAVGHETPEAFGGAILLLVPIAGVSGRELSCTASRVLLPLASLTGDRRPARSMSSSSPPLSPKLDADFGVGWLTMMLGVGGGSRSFVWEGKGEGWFREADRGGDLTRLVLTGTPPLICFCTRCWSFKASDDTVEESRGVPAAESALCIAAAEGVVGMLKAETFGVRWGLRSWLPFLGLVSLVLLLEC